MVAPGGGVWPFGQAAGIVLAGEVRAVVLVGDAGVVMQPFVPDTVGHPDCAGSTGAEADVLATEGA